MCGGGRCGRNDCCKVKCRKVKVCVPCVPNWCGPYGSYGWNGNCGFPGPCGPYGFTACYVRGSNCCGGRRRGGCGGCRDCSC